MTVKRYEMNHKGLPEHDANGSFVLWEDHAELQRQLTAYEATVTSLTAQVQGLADARNSFVDEVITAMVSSGAQTFGDCIAAVNGLRKEQGK